MDIFSKNKCIMSTGNERGNFVELSSKSILRPLIPNNKKYIYKIKLYKIKSNKIDYTCFFCT